MPVILIEGLDGTGKTTLADSLSDLKGWPIVNLFEGRNKTFLNKIEIKSETYHEDIYFMDFWKRIGKPTVIKDRGILSGVVYNDDVNRFKALEYWYRGYNTNEMKIIILQASNKTIIERDKDWEDKENELNLLRKKYEKIIDYLKIRNFNLIELNSEKMNQKEILSEVEKWLTKNFHL